MEEEFTIEEGITRAAKTTAKKKTSTAGKKTSTTAKKKTSATARKKTAASAKKKTSTSAKKKTSTTTAKKKTTTTTTLKLSAAEKKLITNFRKCNDLEKTIITALTEKAAGGLGSVSDLLKQMPE